MGKYFLRRVPNIVDLTREGKNECVYTDRVSKDRFKPKKTKLSSY